MISDIGVVPVFMFQWLSNSNFTTATPVIIIVLTKTTAAQNEVALSYHKVRGQYFLAVDFVAIMYTTSC